MQDKSMIEKLNLDKTQEFFEFIKETYKNLNIDELLVVDYTGNTREQYFYHLVDWYYNDSQKVKKDFHYSQDYFNYEKLITLLNDNNIDYYNIHIKTEFVKKSLEEASWTSMIRPSHIKINSQLFVGIDAKQKAKKRNLITE